MKQIVFLFLLSTQAFSQTVVPLPVASIDAALLSANFTSTNNSIDISNVIVTASDSSIGLFHSYTDYPMEEGLVLSTGGAEWAFNGNFNTGPISNHTTTIDPYLQSLSSAISQSGSATNFTNLVSIEFDFIPHFDAINFEYTFASTEFKSFTCSQFNDIFGFFITGPNISGTYHNGSKNLAIVPGSNETPVCINSINSGFPSAGFTDVGCLYVDPDYTNHSSLFNTNVVANLDYINFPFNGYTDNLSIIDSLIPDSTYHLKIVISDLMDNAYNSAVFLSGNSFISYPMDTAAWGCMDSTAINYNPNASFDDGSCLYQNVGVDEINVLKDILSHMSNPIMGDVLEIPHLEPGMEISIYDYSGTVLLKSKEIQTDISSIDSGIYIIEINNGKFRTSSKFIKL